MSRAVVAHRFKNNQGKFTSNSRGNEHHQGFSHTGPGAPKQPRPPDQGHHEATSTPPGCGLELSIPAVRLPVDTRWSRGHGTGTKKPPTLRSTIGSFSKKELRMLGGLFKVFGLFGFRFLGGGRQALHPTQLAFLGDSRNSKHPAPDRKIRK